MIKKKYFHRIHDTTMREKKKKNEKNEPLFPAWASGPLQHTVDLSPPESVAQMNPDKSVIKGAKVWLQQ